MSEAQRKALANHRRRRRDRGVVRVEVQVPPIDARTLRDIAAVLRGSPDAAQAMRDRLRAVVAKQQTASVLDIFGTDLPDAFFDGLFEQNRAGDKPRDVEL